MSHRHTWILLRRDSGNKGKCLTDTLGYSQKKTQETQVRVSQTHWDQEETQKTQVSVYRHTEILSERDYSQEETPSKGFTAFTTLHGMFAI